MKVELMDRFNPQVFETKSASDNSAFICPICRKDTWVKVDYIQEEPTYISGISRCG